ncbi:MAG: Fic family protein [Hyphomicrobiaceae bacterium]|nr:Fic family protein [Hyphomicrobiaceae bacterium]
MPFDPAKPYNDLPDLPPPGEIETRQVLKACIEARSALASLNAEARQLPNPDILIGSLTLFEAKDSSEIENIVTTDDKLFQHSQLRDADADPATKEALRYRDALYRGYRGLSKLPVSTRLATETCSIIKGYDAEIRRVPGTTLTNAATGEVIYTPPVGAEIIAQKLANWERFIHEATDLDPLVRLAVQHYQFEAIHPFIDGNGRTGRILNILFLIEQKLLDLPILYLSREFLETRARYYSGLRAVTERAEWTDWVHYVLETVERSALRAEIKIHKLLVLRQHGLDFLRAAQPKLASRELIDILFSQPYCRIADLVDNGIARRQTAAEYLKKLVSFGMLAEVKVGREKLFLNKKLRELLTTDGDAVTEYVGHNSLPGPKRLFPSPDTTPTG